MAVAQAVTKPNNNAIAIAVMNFFLFIAKLIFRDCRSADSAFSYGLLPDRERLHKLGAAAVGVEQVQLPSAIASDLWRPDARRIARSFARRFQRLLNIRHEQRHVMQCTQLLTRGSRSDEHIFEVI